MFGVRKAVKEIKPKLESVVDSVKKVLAVAVAALLCSVVALIMSIARPVHAGS
jgi:hypothetical protein